MIPPELKELIEKLRSQRQELLEQVQRLSEDEAARRPADGGWSAKEQLYHVIQGEENWVRWALMVCGRPGSQVGPLPGSGNPPGFPGAQELSLAQLTEELEAARRKTLAAIGGLTQEELSRRGLHRRFGELTVLQMLRSLYRHDRMHMDQMAGQPSSFALRDSAGREISL